MKRATISAIVLTKNEEKNLRLCLEYLDWVDELVIVDSGSNDSTLETAEEFGARIFINISEKFYIAEQRNWALDNTQIKSDWVLFVDADEVISEPLKNEIIKAASQASDSVTAFQLCFKFMFMGRWLKHVYGYPSWHDRLVRFGKTRFKGDVWESFDTEGEIKRIYEPYLHYGFNNGMDGWIDRHQRYAEWKAQKLLSLQHYKNRSFMPSIGRLFTTDRRRRNRIIEEIGALLISISPFLRFVYYYVFRKGFLDGKAGFVYCRMMAMYQFMIYLHFLEKKRRLDELPV